MTISQSANLQALTNLKRLTGKNGPSYPASGLPKPYASLHSLQILAPAFIITYAVGPSSRKQPLAQACRAIMGAASPLYHLVMCADSF